ncbi:MAG: glycosyltransferase family protein [Candidatus Bilamarchaeaceae archaeon]
MKVLAIVEAIGLGHAVRTEAALEEFKKRGWEIKVITSDAAVKFFRRNNIQTIDVPLSMAVKESSGKLDIGKTVLENIKISNLSVITKISSIIAKEKPDIVIVDTNIVGVMAARLYKRDIAPLIYITNDNVFSVARDVTSIKHGWSVISNFVQSAVDACVVPDFPPPYTISEYNLTLWKKMAFVGPLTRLRSATLPKTKKGVFVTQGKSNIKNTKFTSFVKNQIKYTENDYEKKFLSSEIVVHHGGHTTALECILTEKPQIAIPFSGYTERINNSKKIEQLGLGRMLVVEWVDEETMNFALDEVRSFKPTVKMFARFARTCGGPRKVYEITESLLKH